MTKVQPVPSGFHTLTPHLVVDEAKGAIDFYKRAFGAQEVKCMLTPDKKVMHAQLKIGDSILFLCDEHPNMGSKSPKTLGGSPLTIHIYVDDADAFFERAIKAGATAIMPPSDMFWGDRYGRLSDPYGHDWSVASQLEVLTPQEMSDRQEAFCRQMSTSST